jgi:hypothetical protein
VGGNLYSSVNYVLNLEFLLKKLIGRYFPIIKFKHPISNSESEITFDTGEIPSTFNFVDSNGTKVNHFFRPRKAVIKNNVVLDSKIGVAYERGNRLVPRSSSWPISELIHDPYNGSDFLSIFSNLKLSDQSLYTSLPSNGFYHWIMEDAPRYLISRKHVGSEVKTLIYQGAPQYVRDFCQIFGIEYVEVPRVFLVPKLILGEKNPETGIPNPHDIKILRDSFLLQENINPKRKIYVSRIGSTRSPIWEKELSLKLEKLGWYVLQCESMNLEQQVEVFQSAETICGPHGAGLTGMVWAKPGTQVIELNQNFRSNCFNFLGQLMGHRMRQVSTSALTLSEIERSIIQ